MLTSGDRQGDAARCRDLDLAAYLVKPVKPAELNRAIAAALPSAPVPVALPTAKAKTDLSTRPLRVLIVEDNAVNQRVVVRLLEKYGHSIALANHGGEALAVLAEERFDLVLMDVQMPVMDGFEATRIIREREAGTGWQTPVVAMTAHAMKGDRERCLAAGMDDYVSKPVQRAELLRVLEWVAGNEVGPKADLDRTPLPAVVNRAAALDRLGGDADLFAEVADLFRADSPGLLDELRRAIATADAPTVQRVAHSLKGSAGYVGGEPASAAAHKLELIGATGDLTAAPAVLDELFGEVARLTAVLATELPPVLP
jgi:two-component system, sensor histidine kinase and response regulator